jgi:D-erythro-7,8-dihydroneopterin triphosphate epimerase
MALITIKNLLLRTQIGFNDHEVGKKQDLLLNIAIEYELQGEEVKDDPDLALNYRTICKDIIQLVEGQTYNLLEKVAQMVINHLMGYDRITHVTVEVDKPNALRFAESVSVVLSQLKE